MRLFLLLIALFAVATSLSARPNAARPNAARPNAARPNIIVVMPDDMGYGDTGATGNTVVRTPNLDRLASESAELTDFYVSPVCSPTRACLMTGRYNYRTRCIDTFKGRSMMDPEEVTIAEVLGGAGYATGIFGKWHLGDNYPMRPNDQGFDESLIHRGGGLAQPSEPIENKRRYTDPILFHNGREVQAKGYCTDIYFDAAIEFMEASKEEGKPFFVYLPPNAPHGPYHDVPEDLLKYYQSTDLTPVLAGNETEKHKDTVARVFAMVENIDQNMGKLDAYLKESGQMENTIVLFFTDNGPNTMRFVGPFRSMKAQVHEGGIRTMFWARWPERLEAGTKSDRIAAHIDVMPTLLDAAGASAPENLKLDGRSILPLLEGQADEWADRNLFLQSHRGNEPVQFHHFAVRQQDWKLVRGTGFGTEEIKEQKPFELYRIGEDPGETKNLAKENPEKVAELKKAYQAWFKDVSSTRKDNYAPPRIVIGDDEETVTDLSIQDWRVQPGAQGWGDGGEWQVQSVNEGPYTASVRWENPIGERDVVLKIGDELYAGSLEEGASQVTFSEVTLPRGNTTVSVDVGGKIGKDELLRFVTFERK
ncbi:MAG: arylsulfatase [Verrucomicrobiales bacterium]|nr:arylsulfatase [Verrucomicrobiales bacterium]